MSDALSRIDRYFQAISICTTFDEAVEATSRFLGRPILIIDTAMNHISHYPLRATGDGDWDSVISTGYVPREYAAVTRANNAMPMPDGMLHRCIHSPANETEMEKYRCRLSSGSLHLGGMMVLADGSPFESDDLVSLQLAAQTLSRCLHDFNEPLYSSRRARHHILCDLLTRDPHDVLGDIRTLHPDLFALEGHPMIVGFSAPHPGDYDLAPYWQHTLSPFIPDGQILQHNGELLYFFPLGALQYEDFLSNLAVQLEHIHIQLAVSDPFTSYLDFKTHAENARQAYMLGIRQEPDKLLYPVRSQRMALMMKAAARCEGLYPLRHPAAEALTTYDAANGTRYCDILRTYLFHFHNCSLAAKALFMHRNTLTYHLERISQLLGVNLEDPAVCQELLLSLMMLENR